MATSQNTEYGDSTSFSASGDLSVPRVTGTDKYHAFISFSGADSAWVHRLIHKLEETIPGIKICTHDRDFTAGKTIIENMAECIQSSQKIVMVLSPEFVDSRWCLFEANLSMFQDCMSHKAIVPIILRPCLMPLYLSHLTYLEAEDEEFFEKLCKRLLRNNAKETEDVLVHFQSSILYGGKHLLSLAAVNGHEEAGSGVFSDTCVPDALKAVVKDPEIYKKAIQLINDTPPDILNAKCTEGVLGLLLGFSLVILILIFVLSCFTMTWWYSIHLPASFVAFGVALHRGAYWKENKMKRITQDMNKKIGEANLLLAGCSILAGCSSKSSLDFVFVSLKDCREMFCITFGSDRELEQCMWTKAMIRYSPGYANCMAKKLFPFHNPPPPEHVSDGICFCQYVAMQIEGGNRP
ncbi:hypothetical protein GDO81_007063 [Engystomops pustulosus]|uniref:TIR domain-containing protein n=1 Tax=Engystomops pustulosus TaxID=76066 RepID=A0AAV7C4S0_ENGPU|nr:hypothetical protein GDO81_007063 [Engystomops pustulosus]